MLLFTIPAPLMVGVVMGYCFNKIRNITKCKQILNNLNENLIKFIEIV